MSIMIYYYRVLSPKDLIDKLILEAGNKTCLSKRKRSESINSKPKSKKQKTKRKPYKESNLSTYTGKQLKM